MRRLPRSSWRQLWCCCTILLATTAAHAVVGDPQLRTDHPYFPGEAAQSTPRRALDFAYSVGRGALGSSTERDKLIRLFLWRAEHFSRLDSPEIYNLPGVLPGSSDNALMIDYDAMRALFSYGYGLCGTNHAQTRVFAEAAGWQQRRRALEGDTGNEWYVDGSWRYVNVDQYTLHFLSNSGQAHFASLDEVVTAKHHFIEWNPPLAGGVVLPQANTHGRYADFEGVFGTVPNRSQQWRAYYRNVWNIAPQASAKMYGEGYTAAPMVVALRKGERFTRWLEPDGIVRDGVIPARAWWGFNRHPGGPSAPYSFVQNAPARDDTPGPPEESARPATYGNGCFDWQPTLARGDLDDGVLARTGSFVTGGRPALLARGPSSLTIHQYTPYTIAASPADGIDPAGHAADGAVLSADARGAIGVELSTDTGATWQAIGTLRGAGAALDFTDAVKGRNQYLLRLRFDNGEGLDSLRLRTVTMLSQAVYPDLNEDSTTIRYESGNRAALDLSPNLFEPRSANSDSGFARKVGDSGNLREVFYRAGSTIAYEATDDALPLQLIYQISLPAALAARGAAWKQIFAAADLGVRTPTPAGAYGRIEIAPAVDGPWTQVAHYSPPLDNQLSHFWVYGSSSDAADLARTTYFVRYTAHNGGARASIRYLRLYGTYTTGAGAAPVEVSFGWTGRDERTATHTVAPGAAVDSWTISTGAGVRQKKVTLSVPATR